YVPVAFVVFAEHIADHKNLSSIIGADLLRDPGLSRTLLGDGVGSMVGAFFGGCPNTTYGESVGCVAITGNASVRTILVTAIIAMVISFFAPFVTFLSTIPSCVMGGVCISLYGFIAVSGLKMIQKVDLNENRNLFVVSVILIAGVGGLTLSFGEVTITSVACSLILGILVNVLCSGKKPEESAETPVSSESAPEPAETSAENAETADNASDEAAASETDDNSAE
ncbi:MAG TPA: uracil permease, partial [Candidatus Scatosoma pullicola]|nr:uracil permease [Candidatus Scatosoma pullicola]